MGKMKKKLRVKRGPRQVNLIQQIEEGKFPQAKERFTLIERIEEDEEFVDEKLSRRILDQAREQQQELEEEFGVAGTSEGVKRQSGQLSVSLGGEQKEETLDGEEEEEEEVVEEDKDYYEDIRIDEAEEKALELFMNKDPVPRQTLGDVIWEKIREKHTELETVFSDPEDVQLKDVDPRVKEMYEGVKDVLSRYRSGKLPKAFKIIPHLSNWEQILHFTEPECWTAAAMYQATRTFTSGLKEKMAQRFFNLVLYPRIRDDMCHYKRLSFHLYQALRKALFKPAAFFKGFLLPLCESGTCTLREAVIIGSVLAKNSIPVIHSSAAILKIAEMDYSGTNSIFLRILLDKKYALPYRVIDATVYHFLRFRTDRRELPVLWHQALLTFAQRYKEDISSEQKEELLELLKVHVHHKITPEVRRELQHSKCRDVEVAIEKPLNA